MSRTTAVFAPFHWSKTTRLIVVNLSPLWAMDWQGKILDWILQQWGTVLRAKTSFFGMAALGLLAGWSVCKAWDERANSISEGTASFLERRQIRLKKKPQR
jgi:hypothetical protein